MTTVALSDISIDGGTQSRVGLDEQVVAEYAAAIRDGADFPPVVLFFDGTVYRLADGFHRFHAYRHAGAVEIEADVRQGTTRDAILFSVGANASHGLRRTNDDKRKAVLILLKDPEWSAWSDREIARRAGVGHNLVSSLRPSVIGGQIDAKRTVTRGGTTYQQDTAKIGVPAEDKAAKREARAAQQAEHDRERDEVAAKLPASIQEAESYRKAAIEGRKPAPAVAPAPEDRIAELEAEVAELREAAAAFEADVAERDARLARLEPMRVQFEQGGVDKVIEGKDEQIRVLRIQVEKESADKVSYKRSLDWAMGELRKRGWTGGDVVIDAKTGSIINGAAA